MYIGKKMFCADKVSVVFIVNYKLTYVVLEVQKVFMC